MKMTTTTKILVMMQHVVMLLMMTERLTLKIRKGTLVTLMMPTWLDSIVSFSWSTHSVMMKSNVTTKIYCEMCYVCMRQNPIVALMKEA